MEHGTRQGIRQAPRHGARQAPWQGLGRAPKAPSRLPSGRETPDDPAGHEAVPRGDRWTCEGKRPLAKGDSRV